MKYFKKGNFIIIKDASDQEKNSFNLATINRVEIDDLQKKIKFGDGELNFSNFISFTLEDGTIKLKADFPNFSDLKTWALANFFFVAKSNGGGSGGTDKGIWNPKTNTPDIFTLLQKSGEFAVIDGLDAGETYNFDFGGTKGGVVAFTIGDKVYFNGVIFQKQESYIPTADQIIYDKTNPLLGSVKDVVDSKGSVANVSINSNNGITSSITNNSTTPTITLGLGDITPTSVNSTGSITGSNLSGTNTGDETKSSIEEKLGVSIVNAIDTEGSLSTQVPTVEAILNEFNPVILNLEEQINLKANQSTTYTKTQVDNALDLKANQSTTYTKIQVDNALDLKADKTQIKNEVLKLTYLLY